MQYRSFADLADTVVRNVHRVPDDVDLVVGVPRSGLMAASLVALHLNLPLQDLEGFVAGLQPTVGRTVRPTIKTGLDSAYRCILVVDDTIDSGKSLAAARARLEGCFPQTKFLYCAIYGRHRQQAEADLIFDQVESPRFFEWNLMRHRRLANACLDIDGVLCHDPEAHENDDGGRYVEFLSGARHLRLPKVPVKYLVTSRLEKYRQQTEAWLHDHGVEFEKLIMLDVATAEERRRLGLHGQFKADFYARSDAELFIESEDKQALEIATLSNKPVLSIEGQRIVWRGSPPGIRGADRHGKRGRSGYAARGRRLLRRILHRGR